jgi:hypothetical protein
VAVWRHRSVCGGGVNPDSGRAVLKAGAVARFLLTAWWQHLASRDGCDDGFGLPGILGVQQARNYPDLAKDPG